MASSFSFRVPLRQTVAIAVCTVRLALRRVSGRRRAAPPALRDGRSAGGAGLFDLAVELLDDRLVHALGELLDDRLHLVADPADLSRRELHDLHAGGLDGVERLGFLLARERALEHLGLLGGVLDQLLLLGIEAVPDSLR